MATINIEELEDMARECRALASAALYEPVRQELLEVAERFERCAQASAQTSSASARFSSRRL
jgi:hypothetical protein